MLDQYIFIYLISENEKENAVHKKEIRSCIINAAVECYNNSWIAFNALRSDAGSGKQPDIILIDHHMLVKNGFHFMDEYHSSHFFDKENTKLYILDHPKNTKPAVFQPDGTAVAKLPNLLPEK
jgi:CheY-like chemotaxis protein